MSYPDLSAAPAQGGTDWLLPQWPVPAHVRALCTTRSGGVSAAPYHSMNLGLHVGDDASAVQRNRERLHQQLGRYPNYLDQVHGTRVLELAQDLVHVAQADGAATSSPGVACTVMVADCLPILLAHRLGEWVAALHAGWRGLAGGTDGVGVVEVAMRHFYDRFRSSPLVCTGFDATNIVAWLGPCIGPQAFEVGDEVRAAFLRHDAAAAACFTAGPQPGKWWADLGALARLRLRRSGVEAVYGNDGSLPWCTFNNPQRFFSHRRDRVSGRMAASVWIDPIAG